MTADQVLKALEEFLALAAARFSGDSVARRPGDRVPFHWPPHPVSRDFHVTPDAWREEAWIELDGERTKVQIARTPSGVFGRSERYWNEAKGETVDEVLIGIQQGLGELFDRQTAISETLGWSGRFTASIRDLGPQEWVCLLYCPVRDIGHECIQHIESHASAGIFGPAMVRILRDKVHPWRRCAQWAVLDMFEDLPSFFPDPRDQDEAVAAIRDFIAESEDDYARAVYKAGVVLGGHICTDAAADALLSLLSAPHRIGRRSAIHAAFHLVEWRDHDRDRILNSVRAAAETETDPQLKAFATGIAADIEAQRFDHVSEPVFADELHPTASA